jgi:hypothetical protein
MDTASEIQRRAVVYRKFLLGGAFTPLEITNLIPLWNHAVGASTAADTCWMSSAQGPSTADLAAQATHVWTQADRLGAGLARLRPLKYSAAEKEIRHQLLNVHLLQAGLVLQVEATLDELQASFKTSVPDPLTHLAEVAERGTVRERPADYVHGSVPDELCHDEAQTKAELLWYVPLEKYVAVAVGPSGLPEGLTLETASLEQLRAAIALKAPDPPRAALITPRKLSGKLFESRVSPDDRENDLCLRLLEELAGNRTREEEQAKPVEEVQNQLVLGNSTAPSAMDLLSSRLAQQEQALVGFQGTLSLLVQALQKEKAVDLTGPDKAVVPVEQAMALEEVEPEVIKRKKALMERVLSGGVLMGSSGGSRSIGEMKLAQNEDATRVLASSMKVLSPTADFEFQYNTVVDEHTA